MNIKYFFGAAISIPLLPLMYFQGKKIRASVPKLPEATGIEGRVLVSSDKQLNILTIGESTIAGVGVETHEEGFTGTFATELATVLDANVNWKVYARSGYTAQNVKEKIMPKVSETSVDLIVIGLGGNDAFELNSPKKWRKHIESLIDEIQLKFRNTPIVFANMPPIKEFPAFTGLIKFTIGNLVELLGEELESLLKNQHNVYYYAQKLTLVDWIERMNVNAEPSQFFSDGVHPSKLTYQVWAKDLCHYCMHEPEIRNYLNLRLGKNEI